MTIRSLLPKDIAVVETDATHAPATLHPDEAKIVAGAVKKRRGEFTMGRHCAREALATFEIRDFPLLSGRDRAPIWPPGFVGSLTHCDGYCAAAVARRADARGLGIDVERVQPLERSVADRICTPTELSSASERLQLDREAAVIAIFSAHESVYKCYYPLAGSVLEHEDLEVTFEPDGHFRARILCDELPAAGDVRKFEGRLAIDLHYVYTAVQVA